MQIIEAHIGTPINAPSGFYVVIQAKSYDEACSSAARELAQAAAVENGFQSKVGSRGFPCRGANGYTRAFWFHDRFPNYDR